MNFNKIILGGNITRDPQLSYMPSNTPVVEFGIAVNKRFKKSDGSNGESVLFIDCKAFARTAEVINQHFHKGDSILVEGELQLDQWEDRDGGKRSKHRVNVTSFQFVGSKGDRQEEPPPRHQSRQAPPTASRQAPSAPPPMGSATAMDDDQIPFTSDGFDGPVRAQ